MKNTFFYFLLLFTLNAFAQDGMRRADVYFDFNRFDLKEKALKRLDSVSALAITEDNVYIFGFTDDKGSRVYNDTLALHRAKAVSDRLKGFGKKAVFVARGDNDPQWNILTDAQKRRVTVYFGIAPEWGEPKELCRGEDGIAVSGFTGLGGCWTPDALSGKDINLKSFCNAWQMIKEEVYAVDTDNNILQTGGMFSVDLSDTALEVLAGRPLTVKVPVKGKPVEDMTIWVGEEVNGVVRWKNIKVPVALSKDKKSYILKVPPQKGRRYYNADKPTRGMLASQNGKNYNKIVYVATNKAYDFRAVGLKNSRYNLSFSARVNDTLWAFTAPEGTNVRAHLFTGVTGEDVIGKRTTLKVVLNKCVYSTDANGNDWFYICPDCVKKSHIVKEKGFWIWVKRTLGMA